MTKACRFCGEVVEMGLAEWAHMPRHFDTGEMDLSGWCICGKGCKWAECRDKGVGAP